MKLPSTRKKFYTADNAFYDHADWDLHIQGEDEPVGTCTDKELSENLKEIGKRRVVNYANGRYFVRISETRWASKPVRDIGKIGVPERHRGR